MSETIYFLCPSCRCRVEVTPADDTIRPSLFDSQTLTCPLCSDKLLKGFGKYSLDNVEYHLNGLQEAKKILIEENAAELERMKHAVTIMNNEEEGAE